MEICYFPCILFLIQIVNILFLEKSFNFLYFAKNSEKTKIHLIIHILKHSLFVNTITVLATKSLVTIQYLKYSLMK